MRIVFFTDVYRPTINGVVTSIDWYAEELRNMGHTVTIICPDYKEESSADEDDVVRLRSFVFKGYDEYRIAVPFSGHLESHMRNHKYDIIHIHSPFSIGLAGISYGYRYKIPVIYTAHTKYSDYLHYIRGGWVIPKSAVHKAESFFTNRLAATIAPSQKIATILREHGTHNEVFVLPTGVRSQPLKGSRSNLKARYGLGSNRVALYLGRITKEKRLDYLLRSFALAKHRGLSNTTLVLAGDGPYANELKQQAADLGIMDEVIFAGFVSGQDLADMYSAADVFCHVSHSETQGITLLEASSYGIPLLVSKDEAYHGIACDGYNALVVDGDEAEYAAALLRLLTEPSLEKLQLMGRHGKAIAREVTMPKQAERLVSIYETVICSHRSRVIHEE